MIEPLDYTTIDPTNPHDLYRVEQHEVLTLLDVYKDDSDGLMAMFAMVWKRGHAAAQYGITSNPYARPDTEEN